MIAILIDVGLFAAGIVVGTVTHYWFAVAMRQPLLKASGGGGGRTGAPGSPLNNAWNQNVTLSNEVRRLRLGIGIPHTMVLGRRVWMTVNLRPVVRETARECRAALHDESGEHICQLFWKGGDTSAAVRDIPCGTSAHLPVFWWRTDDSGYHNRATEYFAFQPTSGLSLEPTVDGAPHFTQSMRFVIRIRYQFDSKTLDLPAAVTLRYDGTMNVQIAGSGTG